MFKKLGQFLSKNSPAILTGLGIAGLVASGVLAVKETPKALALIEEVENEEECELTLVEKAKVTWKCYLPSVGIALISVLLIADGSKVLGKRAAIATAACKLAEETYDTYKDKVLEVAGEKKETQIRDEIAKDELKKRPVVDQNVVITGKGNSLILDTVSGQYFRGDIEFVRKVINDLNAEMLTGFDNRIMVDDYCYGLGIPLRNSEMQGETGLAKDLMWTVDNGLINPHFSSEIAPNGEPCLVIGHYNPPKFLPLSYGA